MYFFCPRLNFYLQVPFSVVYFPGCRFSGIEKE